MEIGKRLKIARESIGYTQEKTSQLSGIGVSSISDFENDKRPLKFSHLSKLAEVYKRTIEFFLMDKLLPEEIMLWCAQPSTNDEKKEKEAEFEQLCQQYRRLEILTGQAKQVRLPWLDVSAEQFKYRQSNLLAEKVQKEFQLGDIPSLSLKQIMEENYYVKIFHLEFSGSAISTVSPEFGPAVLLNAQNKLWRRNFDLAHELFHILTWKIFRDANLHSCCPSEYEERLANVFASKLLLPTDIVKDKIESAKDEKGQVGFEALNEIAREFGVSLEALLWRILYLYNKSPEDIEKLIEQSKSIEINRPPRRSGEPDKLPERYCSLAIKALKDGKLSLMQFAKYMGMSYKKAQEYLMEDEDFKDEKISIFVA